MRKITTALLTGSALLLFTACGTTIEYTPANSSIKKLTPDGTKNCKFLGTGKVSHITGFGELDRIGNTFDIVKKDILAKGGNAYVGNMLTGNPYATNMRYEIYKCPK